MSRIVHSANVRLGGGGHGHTVFEIARGLHAAGLLKELIVGSIKSSPIPQQLIKAQGFWGRVGKRAALYDPTGWVDYFSNRSFDLWASRVMQPAISFEGWTGFCAACLQVAKQRKMKTFLHLGSVHPRTQLELVNAERQNWGLRPIPRTPHVLRVERELELAEKIVVQSRFSERTLVERGISKDKLIRIPLGVDIRQFSPFPSRMTGKFRVLFVGQITLRKGVQYLLEAWRQLGWRDAELWLVGKVVSDCKEVMQHYSNLLGVEMIGYLPNPIQAFQSSSVFVLPSVEDGFALVVTEAMACGLPVIVSDHVGAADLVKDGESGFVVEYNKSEGYVHALETLRADPNRARAMGNAGRAKVKEQTWEHYIEQLVQEHQN